MLVVGTSLPAHPAAAPHGPHRCWAARAPRRCRAGDARRKRPPLLPGGQTFRETFRRPRAAGRAGGLLAPKKRRAAPALNQESIGTRLRVLRVWEDVPQHTRAVAPRGRVLAGRMCRPGINTPSEPDGSVCRARSRLRHVAAGAAQGSSHPRAAALKPRVPETGGAPRRPRARGRGCMPSLQTGGRADAAHVGACSRPNGGGGFTAPESAGLLQY